VEYAATPASHLWIAACLGTGGAFLVVALALGLGEALFALRLPVLEAIFAR